MASFISGNVRETILSLQRADLFDDESADRLLAAGSERFVANLRAEMARAPYRLGRIAEHILTKKATLRDKAGNPYRVVTISGRNARGEHNSTVAFVLNYGRSAKYGKIDAAHFWTKAKTATSAELPGIYAEVAEEILKERGLL